MDFQPFHDYRRLVEAGKAQPLSCPDDNWTLILRMNDEDNPVLVCPLCLAVTTPGIALYEQITQAVEREMNEKN